MHTPICLWCRLLLFVACLPTIHISHAGPALSEHCEFHGRPAGPAAPSTSTHCATRVHTIDHDHSILYLLNPAAAPSSRLANALASHLTLAPLIAPLNSSDLLPSSVRRLSSWDNNNRPACRSRRPSATWYATAALPAASCIEVGGEVDQLLTDTCSLVLSSCLPLSCPALDLE